MPFTLDLTISGLNVLMIQQDDCYQCCPKSVRVVAVDTPPYLCKAQKCKPHFTFIGLKVTQTRVTKNNLKKPILTPTEDGDQIALLPLRGMGLGISTVPEPTKPLEIVDGPNGESFFSVVPSLEDCGIAGSKAKRGSNGYIDPLLKETTRPLPGMCTSMLQLPNYGELCAKDIATSNGLEVEWRIADKKMLIAKNLRWRVPGVEQEVKIHDLNGKSKEIVLQPRSSQKLQLSLTTYPRRTNFPQNSSDELIQPLHHFHCFYNLARRKPPQPIIPRPVLEGLTTGGSVICPTPNVRY